MLLNDSLMNNLGVRRPFEEGLVICVKLLIKDISLS